jgi:hypothetical protein
MVPKDVVNPPTCIFTGGPSTSKTTILDVVNDEDPKRGGITYRSDKFTPRAFVSHAANVSRRTLAQIDLLPRLKHHVLVTPELAPLFREREEGLRENLAILTAILDGHGYTSDSGTQGRRGYMGDYLFGWLGATTPLPRKVWEVMGQMGSRVLFFTMPDEDVTDDELEDAQTGVPYRDRVFACQRTVRAFLRTHLSQYGGVHGVQWDRQRDPVIVLDWLKRLARLLARLRSIVPPGEDWAVDDPTYRPPDVEAPYRALACLYNLARGRALVYGRTQLAPEDLPLIVHVALSSAPHERAKLVRALIRHEGELASRQAGAALGVSRPTAYLKVKDLAALGIATRTGDNPQKGWRLKLRPEWAWCLDLWNWGIDTGASSFQGEGGESEMPLCEGPDARQEAEPIPAQHATGDDSEGYDQGGVEVDVWTEG